MENELARFPDTETGGLLLGYSDFHGGIHVAEAADGGYRNTIHESDCFAYDTDYEAHFCQVVGQLYTPPLEIVGIWHKHNRPSRIPFSDEDNALHRQLLQSSPFPCVSILFEKTESRGELASYEARVFLLSEADQHIDITDSTNWKKAPPQQP